MKTLKSCLILKIFISKIWSWIFLVNNFEFLQDVFYSHLRFSLSIKKLLNYVYCLKKKPYHDYVFFKLYVFFKEIKILKILFCCSNNVLKTLPMDRARKMAWKTLMIWVNPLEIWSVFDLKKVFFDQIPKIRWGFFC